MYIEEIINASSIETQHIEFKRTIDEGKSEKGKTKEINWLKTLCAFANTNGGTMYIGVEDQTHKIISFTHEEADRIIQIIHRQIHNRITPLIKYTINTIPIPTEAKTRYIIEIYIEKSKMLPVTLHEEGLLGIYIRNYGRTDIASPEQIRDLVIMSENIPYDAVFTDINFKKEDFSILFQRVLAQNSKLTEKELMIKKIISDKKKLSKGALLFMDECQDIITKVVATQWPGLSKGDSVVLASEEYYGNLLSVIESSLSFITNHSAYGFRKEETGQSAYISYPRRSVLEGVVNAIAHRNYYMQGTQIEINVFKDRLEITSPGSLLGVRLLKKEKDIASIIPRRRNEIICSILEICKYLEGKGTGFDKIVEDYSAYGEKYSPFISCDGQSFTLTLPDVTYANGLSDNEISSNDIYAEGVLEGKNDLKILAFCYKTEKTVKEIADHLSITPSTYFRKNTISRLYNEGFLNKIFAENIIKYKTNHDLVKIK